MTIATPTRPGMAELVQSICRIEAHGTLRRRLDPVRTGWGGVQRQAGHEWFSDAPPLTLWADMAARACAMHGGWVFWIGASCRPEARGILRGWSNTLNDRHVFLAVSGDAAVWAADLLLRSPAAACVAMDARGLSMSGSRRLELAAEAGSALALLWRKPREVESLSVAHYRWRLTPQVSPSRRPRWRIEQLRCKDAIVRSQGSASVDCVVERDDAEGFIAVPAELVDGSGIPAVAAAADRRAG